MKTVTLLTYHTWRSKRRAGFHHIGKAFHENKWRVLFLTTGISLISLFQKDARLNGYSIKEFNTLLEEEKNLYSYIHFTPWHSVGLPSKSINQAISPFIKIYQNFKLDGIDLIIKNTDIFIFESSDGLFLFEKIVSKNQKAKYVYRMSDLLSVLRKHPSTLTLESKIINKFDRVSVPSLYMKKKFEWLKNLTLDYHGIDRHFFDEKYPSPFKKNTFNAVWVGNWHFDYDFLKIASGLKPDWIFHIIGDVKDLFFSENIIYYGEISFSQTIPYIQHANVGLDNLVFKQDVQSRSDSLKILQYTYAGLPVVLPDFLKNERKNSYYYTPGDHQSIAIALEGAQNHMSNPTDKRGINTWEELSKNLSGKLWGKRFGQFEDKKTSTISIVIPTYNSLKHLKNLLKSLEKQTAPLGAFDVIIVDDGSTDETVGWVGDFQKKSPLKIQLISTPNQGPGSARNIGATEARTKWIGFLDADVTVPENWVEVALALEKPPKVGAYEGRVEVPNYSQASMFTHQTENLNGGKYTTCNLLIRKELVNFSTNYRGAFREDSDLAFSIIESGFNIVFEPNLKAFHPSLPSDYLTPLRLVKRNYYDALLKRRHPLFYKTLDSHNFWGISIAHLRKKLLLSFLLGQVSLILSIFAPTIFLPLLTLVYAPTLAAAILPYLRYVSKKQIKQKEFLKFLVILHGVPWVLAYSLLKGAWDFRHIQPFTPSITSSVSPQD
jgi:2-beta-glucuronyltransferase